jgi:hypothetical protein
MTLRVFGIDVPNVPLKGGKASFPRRTGLVMLSESNDELVEVTFAASEALFCKRIRRS